MSPFRNSVAAIFMTALAGNVMADEAVQPKPQPIHQNVLGQEHRVPKAASMNETAGTTVFRFSERRNPKGVRTRKEGMYDEIVGVACEWTLTFPNSEVPKEVTGHVCTRVEEMPAAWNQINRDSMGPYQKFVRDVSGDPRVIEVASAKETGTTNLEFLRAWDRATHTVCLAIEIGTLNGVGKWDNTKLNNGCYQLDPLDFATREARALKPALDT